MSPAQQQNAASTGKPRLKYRNYRYLRDFVYGAIDGTVTTFAVVTSVAGAGLNTEIVVVLGLANLLGDGFSMAAGNYLGTRTEEQMHRKTSDNCPETHRDKVVRFQKRLTNVLDEVELAAWAKDSVHRLLEEAVQNPSDDETGTVPEHSAWMAAVTTFVAFILVGMLPLVAFVFGALGAPIAESSLYFSSVVMTAVAFFLIGTAKSFFVDQKWYWSGFETLSIGGAAAGLAFVVGISLKTYAGSP
ncbi:MAG: VIT1/CCC1 transporter family protein [Planctomycetota bacterium]